MFSHLTKSHFGRVAVLVIAFMSVVFFVFARLDFYILGVILAVVRGARRPVLLLLISEILNSLRILNILIIFQSFHMSALLGPAFASTFAFIRNYLCQIRTLAIRRRLAWPISQTDTRRR